MEPRYSDEYDGRKRLLYPKTCVICETTFWIPKNQIPKRNTCSAKCRGENDRKREEVQCAFCHRSFERVVNRIIISKSGLHFCDRKCKDAAQCIESNIITYSHYTDGNRVYRSRAFRAYGKICNQCKYDEDERMLDVDHKDNDRKNGAILNLQVLCLWCHGLKTRGVPFHLRGPVAQLGERLRGTQEVVGSSPIGSTDTPGT